MIHAPVPFSDREAFAFSIGALVVAIATGIFTALHCPIPSHVWSVLIGVGVALLTVVVLFVLFAVLICIRR